MTAQKENVVSRREFACASSTEGIVRDIFSLAPLRAQGRTYVVGKRAVQHFYTLDDQLAHPAVRTIQEGLARLHAGDMLLIQPGIYHEAIIIPSDDIMVAAAGPGVVIDGSAAIQPALCQPAAGRPGIFVWELPPGASVEAPWVFYNDDMLICRRVPLDPAADQMCFYIDIDARRVELNINGHDIPAAADIRIPVIESLVDTRRHHNITLRGLELVRSAGHAVFAWESEGLRMEYNLIRQAGLGGVRGGSRSVYARNTITLCNGDGIHHSGRNSLIEENLIVANNVSWNEGERWTGNLKQNGGSHCVYRHNWVMDHIAGPVRVGPQTRIFTHNFSSGIWSDLNCFGNTYECNALARLPHAAIYIEYAANRNVAYGNTAQDCAMGVTLRQASENLVTRNWIWDHRFFGLRAVDTTRYACYRRGFDEQGRPISEALESAMWGRQLFDGLSIWHTEDSHETPSRNNALTGNLVQVSGRAVNVPRAHQPWPTAERRSTDPRPSPLSNQLSANYYSRRPDDADFALLGASVVPTLDALRTETEWDLNARSGDFTPAVLGLEPIWTIPWAARHLDIPVALLHDPSVETGSSWDMHQPMFWHGSHTQGFWGENAPVTSWLNPQARPAQSGFKCLVVTGSARTAQGPVTAMTGWLSAAIPVKPGLTMGVDFAVDAEGVTSAVKGTGVYAACHFADATGNAVGTAMIIGKGTDYEVLMSGTYAWTRAGANIPVPPGACWMSVFLGLDPADGTVRFDAIHIGMVDPQPGQVAYPCVSGRARFETTSRPCCPPV